MPEFPWMAEETYIAQEKWGEKLKTAEREFDRVLSLILEASVPYIAERNGSWEQQVK